jgi:predicted ATPase
MIRSIEFKNFRVLRDAILPLDRFTLLVGANGSGKSTASQAILFVLKPSSFKFDNLVTADCQTSANLIEVILNWSLPHGVTAATRSVLKRVGKNIESIGPIQLGNAGNTAKHFQDCLSALVGFRVFSFNAEAIAEPVQTVPHPELGRDGSNLAAVLDALTDSEPERFEALNGELNRWLPEFDRILFETPNPGMKGFLLRTKHGQHRIRANALSDGTLFALAMLTLAYLPAPPTIICFEEPDRGIHPRLLRDIQDAMYRLAHPENFGETREPVQVIATTHSPYLLDLYKDNLDQVVISYKDETGAHFERLSDKPHLEELVAGAPLGEIWYSGVLGGVPPTP